MNDFSKQGVIHHKNNVPFLTFDALDKFGIKHGFFLKHGGISEGIYASLNTRFVGKDYKEKVDGNITRIKDTLICEDIYKATQQHTDAILTLTKDNKQEYEIAKHNKEAYDAYITNERKVALAVTTADCNPIMLYDPTHQAIGCVHSGWKGTISHITTKTIEKMKQEYGTIASQVIVCMGPSLKKCHFTTKDENFVKKFVDHWEEQENYITFENQEYHIDQIYCIKQDLLKYGVTEKNIHVADICTQCHTQDFFSYRDAMQQGYKDYATQLSVIYLP